VVRFAEVDLNEDEDVERNRSEESEDEESGEDEEFIDVLDIMDGRANVEDTEAGSENTCQKSTSQRRHTPETDEDQADDQDDISEAVQPHIEDILPSDDEETAPEALDELQNFISALDTTAPKKRKAPDPDAAPSHRDSERSRKHRRVALREHTEVGPENEFHPSSSGIRLFPSSQTHKI